MEEVSRYKMKKKSRQEAVEALMIQCARSEKSVHDAEQLLYRWGVDRSEWDGIIELMLNEKYIDQRRYANAFVRDKMNFGHWGAYKIAATLREKKIPQEYIDEAMAQADPEEFARKLKRELRAKLRTMNREKYTDYKLRATLVRFALSRGYDYETAGDTVDAVLAEPPREERPRRESTR